MWSLCIDKDVIISAIFIITKVVHAFVKAHRAGRGLEIPVLTRHFSKRWSLLLSALNFPDDFSSLQ